MKGLLVPIFSSKPRRVLKSGVAPALLATTSVAALLLATPARAGQAITTPQATVTNPAGHATTSIVITGTTVTGAVTNAGTITPGTTANGGGGNTVTGLAVINSSVGGGITNSGVISVNGTHGISTHGATITGGVVNSGAITVMNNNQSFATAINIGAGGFGALSVNAADSNSFQTTLGVRLTSRIAMGSYGTLIPELRLGWNHEFLDASQVISASLFGVAGSAFSATEIVFGRDAALIGAGFSMELAPDAKVFVDYDGRVGTRLQEHSVSGGLRVRF